jgi:hypothetical protein
LATEAHMSTCSTCRLPDYGKVGEASVYGPAIRIHANEQASTDLDAMRVSCDDNLDESEDF